MHIIVKTFLCIFADYYQHIQLKTHAYSSRNFTEKVCCLPHLHHLVNHFPPNAIISRHGLEVELQASSRYIFVQPVILYNVKAILALLAARYLLQAAGGDIAPPAANAHWRLSRLSPAIRKLEI